MTSAPVVERLKNRKDFVRVTRRRRQHVTPGLILQADRTPGDGADGTGLRVGFTVSRRVGGAVVRNRAKRRLRAAAEEVLARHAAGGHDYVLVGRRETPERPYPALIADLETALRRLHLYKGTPAEESAD